MKYKYNGQWYDVTIKALDSMPVGSIVDYDGQASDIPSGWEQYNDGVVLYSNTTGSVNEITLSETSANYNRFDVIYGWWDGGSSSFKYGIKSVSIDTNISSYLHLEYILVGSDWMQEEYAKWQFNGNKLTPIEYYGKYQSTFFNNTNMRICKVIGYK